MPQRGNTCKIRANGASFRFALAFPAAATPSGAASAASTVRCGPREDIATVRDCIRRAREATAAPPLVLIHGFPLNNLVWRRVSRLTADHLLTIRPNLRGFGELSSLDPFTMPSLADDLHALLSQIDALPCVLAGLSMGGYVALAFAESYRPDLRGLALVSSKASADTPQQKEKRMAMIQQARRGGAAVVADAMLPRLLAPSTLRNSPSVVEELQRIMLDTAAPTIEHACLAMRDRRDLTRTATELTIPTAVIVGEEDQVTPPHEAAALAASMQRCELSVIPRAGHVSPLEQPENVAEALTNLVHRASG